MLTVMSLSAAREGALLPGRKGNRVRLGREAGRSQQGIHGPQPDFLSYPRFSPNSKRGGSRFPARTQNSSTSLLASDIFSTTSS